MEKTDEERQVKRRKTEDEVADLAPSLGIACDLRIQIKWRLAKESEQDAESTEEEEEIWWGATVLGKTDQLYELDDHEDLEDRAKVAVYEILYDERAPDFPTPEISLVCFVGPHQVYDAEIGELQAWRFEGDSWEEGDPEVLLPSSTSSSTLTNASQSSVDTAVVQSDVGWHGEAKDSVIVLQSNAEIEQAIKLYIANPNSGDPVFQTAAGSEDAIADKIVESIVAQLMRAHHKRLESIPASEQHVIMDKMEKAKEILREKLKETLLEKKNLDDSTVREMFASLL